MRPIFPLLLLCACGGSAGPSASKLEALGAAPPRLPAPEARIYATQLGIPADPLVASVVGDLPWEESLSGAAGALGIEAAEGEPPDLWTVRWAALRAGYPYPIEEFSYEQVPEGGVGERVIQAMAQQIQPGDHLGLVRVRGGSGDLWVALLGRPRVLLEPVPRELPPGGELKLAAGPGAGELSLSLVSPSGKLEQGDLWQGRSFQLAEDGEYWVEVRDRHGVAAAFTVVVGALSEPAAPLAGQRSVAADAEGIEDVAWDLLDQVRELYGWALMADDPILGPVARAHLNDRMGADGPASGAFRGEPGSCRASLSCSLLAGGVVEECFQQWLVDPPARAAMLDPRCTVAGVAGGARGERLWLQVELGQE
jgi:hypothetical protein